MSFPPSPSQTRLVGWVLALRAAFIPFGPTLTLGKSNGSLRHAVTTVAAVCVTAQQGVLLKWGVLGDSLGLPALLVCVLGGGSRNQQNIPVEDQAQGRGLLATHTARNRTTYTLINLIN